MGSLISRLSCDACSRSHSSALVATFALSLCLRRVSRLERPYMLDFNFFKSIASARCTSGCETALQNP
eukprot:4729865-Pleurochrysis_carterae.AAC.1